MSRLNKAIREGIIKNSIDASGYSARNEALITRRAKLADEVRLLNIGGVDVEKQLDAQFKKVKKQLSTLDNSLFVYTDYVSPRCDYDIDCNFAGRSVRLYFNGQQTNTREVKYVRKNYVNGSRVVITADNKLNDEFDAIELEQRTINDLYVQVKSEVTAMVNSVTTVKKLLEIWPEAKDLLPKEERVASTAVVADVGKLNVMLNLPKDD